MTVVPQRSYLATSVLIKFKLTLVFYFDRSFLIVIP